MLRYEECSVHMAGFQKAISMRGGLRLIESNTYVRLSLYWIEYNISIDQDIKPQYPPPFHLFTAPYSALPDSVGLLHSQQAVQACSVSSLVSPELSTILAESSLIVVALETESNKHLIWNDSNWVGFGVYPLVVKLLSLRRSVNANNIQSVVQEFFRLSLILFCSEIRRKFGVAPIVTKVQAQKLRSIFAAARNIWNGELVQLRMWALVIAGCAISIQVERIWIIEELAILMVVSKYRQWDEVVKSVSELWWVDDVFLHKCVDLGKECRSFLGT